jgi:hypothetical protein
MVEQSARTTYILVELRLQAELCEYLNRSVELDPRMGDLANVLHDLRRSVRVPDSLSSKTHLV